MRAYNKEQTIDAIENELANIENLYNSKCVNWTGKTSDTNEPYGEVIANVLLRNLNLFYNIQPITRTSSYCRENHCKVEMNICNSNRNEEIFAKRLTGLTLDDLGYVIDYQVPLKDTRADKGAGKIDLISFNEEAKTLFLIELKYAGNKETILRTSLEAFTYSKIVEETKLKDDYFVNKEYILKKDFSHIKADEVTLQPAVLLVPNCQAHEDLERIERGESPKFKALALALGIKYFTLDLSVYETEL